MNNKQTIKESMRKHINPFLSQLFPDIAKAVSKECWITAITDNSRQVIPGSLFVALKGCHQEGNQYIPEAIDQGAALVFTETSFTESNIQGADVIHVKELRSVVGQLLAWFYEVETTPLNLIGVTGTNGKTSVAYLLAQALQGGYVGTLGLGAVTELQPSLNTTPSLFQLYPCFSTLIQQGITSCAMEVSSHALSQQRIAGLRFSTAVFTNLSHDHLDYHGSMEAYAEAKFSLFNPNVVKNAVINIACPWGYKLWQRLKDTAINCLTYGLEQADMFVLDQRVCTTGTQGLMFTPAGQFEFETRLIGKFNTDNLLACVGVLLFAGYSITEIKRMIAQMEAIIGRMEIVSHSPTFVVDYAHTPDALEKALNTLRPLCQGKLWCVFGCGGDRDPTKRPAMGTIAHTLADQVILTSDNPRSEDPVAIINDIKQECVGGDRIIVIPDRAAAIEYCYLNAAAKDVILVAGKGHEDYQIISGKTLYFSDQHYIRKLIDEGQSNVPQASG